MCSAGSSLPPSSPPQPFSDFNEDVDEVLIEDEIPDLQEDEEGEGKKLWETRTDMRFIWPQHGPRLHTEPGGR